MWNELLILLITIVMSHYYMELRVLTLRIYADSEAT